MNNQVFQTYLERYLTGDLTPEEIRVFLQLLNESEYQEQLKQAITRDLVENSYNVTEDEARRERIREQLQRRMNEETVSPEQTTPIVQVGQTEVWPEVIATPQMPLRRRLYIRVAAAAAIILVLAAGAWWWRQQRTVHPGADIAVHMQHDALPGGYRATLTLSGGSTIILDSAQNGTLAQQGSTQIQKLANGQLAYQRTNNTTDEILYNSVVTPKGGQYQLTLSDGTKVWLNAASSLRFPAHFKGGDRKVELRGEAYFEVAPDSKRPFLVKLDKGSINVLGTSFNIDAYNDEPVVKATLLSGAISLQSSQSASIGQKPVLLRPGQQAQFSDGAIAMVADPDVEEAIAWKNGRFQFDNADIDAVMRQVARWYDLDVSFTGAKPAGHYHGKISRDINASQMLKIIEASGVHYKIEGKEITIY